MRYFPTYLLLLLVSIVPMMGQERAVDASFILEGQVLESENFQPVSRVNIEITGKGYTTTDVEGQFSIRANVGDELVARYTNFRTVYYVIKDRQKVTVMVKANLEEEDLKTNSKRIVQARQEGQFDRSIDSARHYLKIDAQKSIEFVTQALEALPTDAGAQQGNAMAYETLGDINMHWQLPDLAIANYQQSLIARNIVSVNIKLARAFQANGNYQESIELLKQLLEQQLTDFQRVGVYEGLGDNYLAIDDAVKSVFNYQKGLDLANQRSITPKITDLNSKIGEAYASSGAVEEAETYFRNSLNLSEKENRTRAAREKNTVADFYNQTQDFGKEIELRQEALNELEDLDAEDDVQQDLASPLTPQRQNYKIANAFVAQDKYEEAIPFLERSIDEADANEDLVVQKDATRKLSEIYRDIGDFDKAAASYERYVEVVDELYIKKEQELSQAARFSKEIALRQNRITSLENERALNESRYALAVQNQDLIEKNNQVQKWIIGSLVVIALLLLYLAFMLRRNIKSQVVANNQLALKQLRTQMNPHFIFNALNSVNSFISSSDERAANRYLSDFSQLMRSVLENSEEDFIPMSKEIELLELYVKLEHFRFQDKFDYEIRVDPHIDVDSYVIPPMLLQPYVENAVWHGLRYKEDKGLLEIDFKQSGRDAVVVTIKDNGIGRERSNAMKTDNQKKQKSKGMGNIKRRIAILNRMYKDKVDVQVSDVQQDGSGTCVTLTIKKD